MTPRERSLVLHGDALELLAEVPDASIDSVVTDPPYALEFMGRAWDRFDTGDQPGSFRHWCELWARECLRILKPGGHLLAFGGSRTWHRLAAGIEDAGFELRDSIAWLYGSGFPKSHNLTGEWSGWGTALKPAFEPVVVARKPLVSTVAANVLAHGTGALNIDATRIVPSDPEGYAAKGASVVGLSSGHGYSDMGGGPRADSTSQLGRWPANVILDELQAAALDEQSGYQRDGVAVNRNRDPKATKGTIGIGRQKVGSVEDVGFGSGGGASRFFYVAKAPKSERPIVDGVAHPTVKPLSLMRWLCRLVTPPHGVVLEPFAGSGTTIEAALLEGFFVIGIEREAEYLPLIDARIDRVPEG